MKTYWDYSEKERSELSHDEIVSLLDVELMTKGVKKIEAPILKPIKSVKLNTEMWFEVEDILFKTVEQARQFITLNPHKSAYDYDCGYDYSYAREAEQKIEQKSLYSRQELLNLASILKENKSAKDDNEKSTNVYDKAKKAQDEILAGVWEDWYNCKNEADELKVILRTREEYIEMANGDIPTAESFLRKIYSEERIAKAIEWFGDK